MVPAYTWFPSVPSVVQTLLMRLRSSYVGWFALKTPRQLIVPEKTQGVTIAMPRGKLKYLTS